jgi:hypothetical protein
MKYLKTTMAVLAVIVATVLIVAMIITLTGKTISEIGISDGTVVSKKFIEEHTADKRHCVFTGRVMSCSTRPAHYDDYWQVVITKEEDGEPVFSVIEVTEAQYNSLNEGDYFDSKPNSE